MITKEKACFPISVIAEELKVHQRTLRIYDDLGILKPDRSPKNRRLYSINTIERGKVIQFLTKELGMNIAGIRIVFEMLDNGKVQPCNYLDYLKNIASLANITPEIQAENKVRLSTRGRKKGR